MSSPSGPVVQKAESSRGAGVGGACGSVSSVSGLTVSFAKAAVSIASRLLAPFSGAGEKFAHLGEIGLGLLDEAHVAGSVHDHELAAGNTLVHDPSGARCRRAVVLAHDHQRRLADVAELRPVVEVAVPGVRAVAK